jgi:hypothetical protein
MRNQEPAIDKVDIGFDAAETAVQRVQQRALVLIIIMSMGVNQRHGLGSKAQRRQRKEGEAGQQLAW